MSTRDSAHSITSQLIYGLLFGNLLAILGVVAFRPFTGLDEQTSLVLAVGVMSLVVAGLLFLASALSRRAKSWWLLAMTMNVMQIGRLVAGVVAIAMWAEEGGLSGMIWAFMFVPFLGVLSAVGLVMTVREARKARRRRLSHA